MNILHNNITALDRSYNGLGAYLLQHYTADTTMQIISSKSGMPTARINEKFIHSNYNPEHEAMRYIKQMPTDTFQHYIVYGYGLGYYVEALQRCAPDTAQIYVLIDSGSRFLTALSARNLVALCARGNIHYLIEVDANTILALIQNVVFDTLQEVVVRQLFDIDIPYFSALKRSIQTVRERKITNARTTKKFGERWFSNGMRNMHKSASAIDCAQLRKLYAGIPAVIVGAGPTLDEHYELLAKTQGRMLCIAVDTALVPLIRGGIRPDFVVTVDPQFWNSRHTDFNATDGLCVVYDMCVHPRSLMQKNAVLIASASMVPIARLIQRSMGITISLGAGGTVTTSAWEFAKWIGCSEIYLCGVDFAYPHNRIHCHGCFFEERMHTLATRLCSAESHYSAYWLNSPLIPTTSYGGAPLRTDQRMHAYATWLGQQIERATDQHTYTVSDAGARIKHVTLKQSDAMLRYPQIAATLKEKRETLLRIQRTRNATAPATLRQTKQQMETLLDALEALNEHVRKARAQSAPAHTPQIQTLLAQQIDAADNDPLRRESMRLFYDTLLANADSSKTDDITKIVDEKERILSRLRKIVNKAPI